MATENTTPSRRLCAASFAPIRAYVRKNQGAIVKLTAIMQDITGEGVNRHMVGRWLREKEAVQPRHGYGLALIEAYERLLTEG